MSFALSQDEPLGGCGLLGEAGLFSAAKMTSKISGLIIHPDKVMTATH